MYCIILNFSLTNLLSYTQNGLLHMLDRNRRIKPRPERFQTSKDKFDILVTCEERVYDQVVEGKYNGGYSCTYFTKSEMKCFVLTLFSLNPLTTYIDCAYLNLNSAIIITSVGNYLLFRVMG